MQLAVCYHFTTLGHAPLHMACAHVSTAHGMQDVYTTPSCSMPGVCPGSHSRLQLQWTHVTSHLACSWSDSMAHVSCLVSLLVQAWWLCWS
jgi:hypothetical protein